MNNSDFLHIDENRLSAAIDRMGSREQDLVTAGKLVLKILRRRSLLEDMRRPVHVHYSIYIPSKLNAVRCITPRILLRGRVPFKLVVEPQDEKSYREKWGGDNLILLPENDMGLSYARNFIKKYSRKAGERKHWQLDDDIGGFSICDNGDVTTAVNPSRALAAIESGCEGFLNIALAAPSNQCFSAKGKVESVSYNKLVASCVLVDNSCDSVIWSIDRVEDIDCCLEVLKTGWCTLKFIKILMGKANDLQVSGNYQSMEKYRIAVKKIMEKWPGVFSVTKIGRLRGNRIWNIFQQRPISKKDKRNLRRNTIIILRGFKELRKKNEQL